MRIAILGGGPAGLYFGYLWKQRHPRDRVEVLEQNPADATWGFGVVFSDRALDLLRQKDRATADDIAARTQRWRNMTVALNGDEVTLDGIGFSAIGRLDLLRLLQQRARSAGVVMRFATRIRTLDELGKADLIVGADGINSLVRRTFATEFGASLEVGNNRFAWYGTTRAFATLTQTFVEAERGAFTAHHYGYAPDASTFLIECDAATFDRYGFERVGPEESRRVCEAIFADALGGHPLISNNSVWRRFPWIRNARWYVGNMVLLGDALHTAHFSIGSGTRLALEDALALNEALERERDLGQGLARFEAERRPAVEILVAAARTSAACYERFPQHMRLPLLDFAHAYATRSGRIGEARLRAMSPAFMARYDAARSAQGPA